MVANEVVMFPDEEDELASFPEPPDNVSNVSIVLTFSLPLLLSFISINSENNPGFAMTMSLISISPVSILTTVDIVGRSFGMSWVQRRPILRNLHASSMLTSPSNDASTNSSSSPLSCLFHACGRKL